MSRGFGLLQRWLLGCIGAEPMTFEQILARAYPEGSFEGDMAQVLGSSNVSPARSLRRALSKLCDLRIIQVLGRRPHRYRLDPLFVSQGVERAPERIWLVYQILKDEPGETFGEKDGASRRRMAQAQHLIEARDGHFAGRPSEFYDWAEREFGKSREEIMALMGVRAM